MTLWMWDPYTHAPARASPAPRRCRQAQRPHCRRAAGQARLSAPARAPGSRKAAGSRAGSGEKQPPTGRAAEGHRGGAQEPGAPRGGHSRQSGNYRMRRRPHSSGRERLPSAGGQLRRRLTPVGRGTGHGRPRSGGVLLGAFRVPYKSFSAASAAPPPTGSHASRTGFCEGGAKPFVFLPPDQVLSSLVLRV